jgi:hypothetical protein
MLDNVNKAIDAITSGGAVQSYSIGGRNIQKIPLSELLKLRQVLKQEVKAGRGSTTYVRFDNPS